MRATIDQLLAAERERRRWDEKARAAQKELEKARGDLEKQVWHNTGELRESAEKGGIANPEEGKHCEAAQETDDRCRSPQNADTSAAEQLTVPTPPAGEAQEHPNQDIISLHHIAWGSQSVHDTLLEDRLTDCAARGHGFVATRDFVGHDTGPSERRTLVVAYSKPPDGPMRWLVVDEGGKGSFGLE